VREVMRHGETGLLVDFHDHEALARQVVEVLSAPGDFAHLGRAARQHMIDIYDFGSECLPEHIARINSMVPKARAIPMPT
jgi:glycosyltransferase involved in cell wall biosynthesis